MTSTERRCCVDLFLYLTHLRQVKTYGLLGRQLGHSFSAAYFADKFAREGRHDAVYKNFELKDLGEFQHLLQSEPTLCGLNVTLPYKQKIIPYLDTLAPAARRVGAVNTIAFADQQLVGYNTDDIGFAKALEPYHHLPHIKQHEALVLGTGGAARAVWDVLAQADWPFFRVSRTASAEAIDYAFAKTLNYQVPRLIVNTSPLGMYPHTQSCPDLAYHLLETHHVVIDLVYNPQETLLLLNAKAQGAQTQGGINMLHEQAEAAWQIWNDKI